MLTEELRREARMYLDQARTMEDGEEKRQLLDRAVAIAAMAERIDSLGGG